jgi:hypothetical protein
VQDIANNRDFPTLEVALATCKVSTHRERVEQCLGGVLVGTVTGVDHRAADPARMRELVGCTAGRMTDDDSVGAHGLQGQRGVLEALTLGHARALGRKVDDISREPFSSRLEGDPGAGGVLEEQVDHRAAAQCGQLLDSATSEGGEFGGRIEDEKGVVAIEVSGGEQVALHRASASAAPACPLISTASSPSCSETRT